MAYDNERPYEDENVGDEVYNEEGLEYLEENDEITPEEEAFMEGYKQTPPARLRTLRRRKAKKTKKKSLRKKAKRKPKKSRKHARRKRK